MYYPYFRGKVFELGAIKEMAEIISASGFVPVIEPVREPNSSLTNAVKEVARKGGKTIVVVNPQVGDIYESGDSIAGYLKEELGGIHESVLLAAIVGDSTTAAQVGETFKELDDFEKVLLHFGNGNADLIDMDIPNNIFFDSATPKVYRKKYEKSNCILLRDCYQKRKRNRDHPDVEFFSDLHLTYSDDGMNGFGDLQMVGDSYSEGGGPAYTVAIHLTSIDAKNDDIMCIHHFKSDRQDSPEDPAGKFLEALTKFIAFLDSPNNQFYETKAVAEFRDLFREKKFPGLGYSKKLSMMHHIETLSIFLNHS